MRMQPGRRFTLLDVMILVAATALAIGIMQNYTLHVLGNTLAPYPAFSRVSLRIWAYIMATMPFPASWSLALFFLRLRRPRPTLRRLTRQPGLAACGAVSLVVAVRFLGALILIARTIGNPFYSIDLDIGDAYSVTVSFPGPVNYSTVQYSAYFASSTFAISMAVSASWLLLAASGRWHPEPGWIDRAGRILGGYWIAIIPLSCWWDYHMLY